MREIKFRGKVGMNWWYVTPDSDDWEQFWAIVDRETVGEYITLYDKQNKEIYEGDIVRSSNGAFISLIEDIHAFCGETGMYGDEAHEVEIIGNIYENPDLVPV